MIKVGLCYFHLKELANKEKQKEKHCKNSIKNYRLSMVKNQIICFSLLFRLENKTYHLELKDSEYETLSKRFARILLK